MTRQLFFRFACIVIAFFVFLLSACSPAPAPSATSAPTIAPTALAMSTLAPSATPTLTATPHPTLTPTITPTPAPDTSAALALARTQIKNFNDKDFSVTATWLADKRALVVIQSKIANDAWVWLPGAKEFLRVPPTAGIDNELKLVNITVENGKVVGYTSDGRRFVRATWDKLNGEKSKEDWYAVEPMKVEWDATRPAESLMKVMKEKWNDGPILRQEDKENYQLKGYKEISAKELYLYVLNKYKDVRFSFPNVVSPSGEVIFSENENPWFVLASLVSRVEEMQVIPTPNTAVWVDKAPDGKLVMKINIKNLNDGNGWGNSWNNGEPSPALRLAIVGAMIDAAAQAKLITDGNDPNGFNSVGRDAEARVIAKLYRDFSDYDINSVDRVDSVTMRFFQIMAKGADSEFKKGQLPRGRVVFSVKEAGRF